MAPPVQTTYTQYMRPAVAGQIADMTPNEIISRVVETTAGIAFGAIAVQGTGDSQIRVSAAGRDFVGVTLLDPSRVPLAPTATPSQYQQNDEAAVMLRGTVWVTAGATITLGAAGAAAAGYVPATGAFVLATTAGATAIPNGRYDTSAASGALVKLRLV